jgi:hypothetical protein
MSDSASPSYRSELVKSALSVGSLRALGSNLGQRALSAGGLSAVGGAGGAGLGALAGGLRGYQQARNEGYSGLRGALGGAATGAALGGAGGAALGAGVGGLGGRNVQGFVRGLARPGAEKPGVVGGIARFGQRQVHGLTGALPSGPYASTSKALESIGGGVAPLRRQVADLNKQILTRGGTTADKLKLLHQRKTLEQGLAAGEKATNMGMTSVPGFFKAMATRPGEALRAAGEYQWKSNPTVMGKAMALGMPASFVASEALRPSQEGEASRGARSLGALGESALYSLAPMPMAGSMATAGLFRGGLQGVSRALRNRKDLGQSPPPPEAEDASASSGVEHVYSNSAQGKPPEGYGA